MLMIIQYDAYMTGRSTEMARLPADPPKDVRPADLDVVDRRILSSLHGDARITNNALAEAGGIAGAGDDLGYAAVQRARQHPQLHTADPSQAAGDGCVFPCRR